MPLAIRTSATAHALGDMNCPSSWSAAGLGSALIGRCRILARRASARPAIEELDEARLVGERDIVAEPARPGFDPEGVGADCNRNRDSRVRERKRPSLGLALALAANAPAEAQYMSSPYPVIIGSSIWPLASATVSG